MALYSDRSHIRCDIFIRYSHLFLSVTIKFAFTPTKSRKPCRQCLNMTSTFIARTTLCYVHLPSKVSLVLGHSQSGSFYCSLCICNQMSNYNSDKSLPKVSPQTFQTLSLRMLNFEVGIVGDVHPPASVLKPPSPKDSLSLCALDTLKNQGHYPGLV